MKLEITAVESFTSKKGFIITNAICKGQDGAAKIIKVIGREDYVKGKPVVVEVKEPAVYFAK